MDKGVSDSDSFVLNIIQEPFINSLLLVSFQFWNIRSSYGHSLDYFTNIIS